MATSYYTFKIGKDNYITTTHLERIVQRSKSVDYIKIYASNDYNGLYMQDFQAIMYYRLPISERWDSKELTPSEELYKNKYVEYIIPVDTWLTNEAGDVQFEIKFYNVSMDGNININQCVRKATDGIIHISSSKDWGAGIADSLLDTVDQRIIQLMMAQKRQEEMIEEAQSIMSIKADNIAKDEQTNEIYLTSQGNEIGDRIKDSCDIDGVPVVDINSSLNPDIPSVPTDPNKVYNIVEF